MNEAIEISKLIDRYLPADGVGTEREQIRMEMHNDIAMLVKDLTISHVSNQLCDCKDFTIKGKTLVCKECGKEHKSLSA